MSVCCLCLCCGDVFQAVPPGRDELPVLEVLAQETSRKVKSKVDGVWSAWYLVGQMRGLEFIFMAL